MFDKSQKLVVIRPAERLNDQEIARAFAGNAGTMWYKALVQLMSDDMENAVLMASGEASKNNALGMATEFGGYGAVNGLLLKIEKLVQSAQ